MNFAREKVKVAFRQFIIDKVHVTFEQGVFDGVIDDIENTNGPLEVNLKVDIPLETIKALQEILKNNPGNII